MSLLYCGKALQDKLRTRLFSQKQPHSYGVRKHVLFSCLNKYNIHAVNHVIVSSMLVVNQELYTFLQYSSVHYIFRLWIWWTRSSSLRRCLQTPAAPLKQIPIPAAHPLSLKGWSWHVSRFSQGAVESPSPVHPDQGTPVESEAQRRTGELLWLPVLNNPSTSLRSFDGRETCNTCKDSLHYYILILLKKLYDLF